MAIYSDPNPFLKVKKIVLLLKRDLLNTWVKYALTILTFHTLRESVD